ncbi:MAG: adenylate kinase, partial [Mycoplasma sp.]|nr:adenylate kinase [Mycoplasma sp.]
MIKNKNIVFLGPPGVGKGTIALHLKENYDLVHISTGEIFRQEIAKQTLLGQQVESIMAKGDYVPDEITNQI